MHTLRAASWTFGFLWPILRFRARMASLGGTVLERMTSEISRLSGMSSLDGTASASGHTGGSSRGAPVQTRRGGALNLLVERAGGRRPEPARHTVCNPGVRWAEGVEGETKGHDQRQLSGGAAWGASR